MSQFPVSLPLSSLVRKCPRFSAEPGATHYHEHGVNKCTGMPIAVPMALEELGQGALVPCPGSEKTHWHGPGAACVVFDFSKTDGRARWSAAPKGSAALYGLARAFVETDERWQVLRKWAGFARAQPFPVADAYRQDWVVGNIRQKLAVVDSALAACDAGTAGTAGDMTSATTFDELRFELGLVESSLAGLVTMLAAAASGCQPDSPAGACTNAFDFWRGRVGMHAAAAKEYAMRLRGLAPADIANACDNLAEFAWKTGAPIDGIIAEYRQAIE